MDKLKDIKPIVEVNEFSIYIFYGVILLCLVVVAFLIYFLYHKFKKEKYSFDLDNPKQTAYRLISLIRDKEGSDKYIDKLHKYTYKKEVPKLDKELFYEIINKYSIILDNKI